MFEKTTYDMLLKTMNIELGNNTHNDVFLMLKKPKPFSFGHKSISQEYMILIFTIGPLLQNFKLLGSTQLAK